MHLTLQIKKRKANELMVMLVLAIVFCFGLFLDLLHLPDAVKYSIDILWTCLFAIMLLNRFKMPNAEAAKILAWVIVFWLITLFGFVSSFKNPVHYLWGFRNNFRFFVYFFACIMFLKEHAAVEILNLFDKIFYLNFAISLFQFFVLGKEMDFLGGIFGVEMGCNGKTIILFSIVLTRSLLRYIGKEESLTKCLVKCGMALVIAALAELKFFFVLFTCIVAAIMAITRTSIRKLWIIIVASVGIYAGATLLVLVFPSWAGFFSVERMIRRITSTKGYTGQGDVNRFTAIPIIWSRFLKEWPERLFGLGLGNCDTSGFAFLKTSFYREHGYLNYNMFSAPFMFLETGILGLASYLLFFVFVYFGAQKREKRGKGNREHCQLARIMALVCVLLIIYNSSMRTEEAFMMFFTLALPFINKTQKIAKEGVNDADAMGKEIGLWRKSQF